jgi:hypothetical protein
MHVFQPLPPEKHTFFSHFHLKNACFSATSTGKTHVFLATSTWKTHVFQPLPPEKCTFFSHFHLKNARFSATSAQKTHVKQQQHSTPNLISQWPQQQ